MKKLISLALIASTSSLLFISSATAKMQSSPLFKGGQGGSNSLFKGGQGGSILNQEKHGGSNSPIITAQIPNNIQDIAQNITVKVHVKDSRGSGILIAKKGQVYTVLTNAHVVNRGTPFRIETPDGKFYNANLIKKGDSLNGDDLAILQFKSNVNYQVAILGNSTKLAAGDDVYTAGFPYEKSQLKLISGKIFLITENPLVGGYQIGYTNQTEQGMSGGAVLNSEGKLIGAIGMGANAILDDAYTYQNGKKPDQDTFKKLRELRFAVPIATITKIDSQLISLLPKEPPKIKQQNYTGIVGDIDKIAGQITVKITNSVEEKNQGSGVIVAKNGNTYYVLTASHVIRDREEIKYPTINIITSDNQKHSLTAQKVTVLKTGKNQDVEVDLAVVEFTSDKTYQVATLGKYELKDNPWVFVSGFPGNLNERLLTGGVVQKEEEKDFYTKDGFSLSTGGYGLLYTNISYGGMSGGAVLDHKGRLVGIHTASENEFINNKEVNLGQSIGVPISTFISNANKAKIQSQWLKIDKNQPGNIDTENAVSVIIKQLFDLKTPSKDDFTEWINLGNQLWRSFQYEKSVTAYDRAIELIKKQPNYSKEYLAKAYYGKGLSLVYLAITNKDKKAKKETFNEAVKTFDLATQNEPQLYQAWRWKGLVLNRWEKYPESLTAYDQAIKINNTDFVLLVERGTVLRESKRYQEAIASYDQAIKIKPHPWALNNRGVTYYDLKEYLKALDDFNKAIEIKPDWAGAYYNRGNIYDQLKEYQKALADFTKAIELKSDYAEVYVNRGIAYKKSKEYQKALTDFTKATELKSDYAEAYYNRGNTYATELKDYQKAIADYNKAIEIKPDFAEAYYNRGNTYGGLNDYQKARTDYNKAIEIKPDFAEAYYKIGLVGYYLKEYQKALTDFTKAIKLKPDYAEAYLYKGFTYYDLKEYQKAIADFNKAIDIKHNYAEAYYARGYTYAAELKEYQKAIADFNKAIESKSDYAEAYYARGSTYKELKEYQKALADAQTAALLFYQQHNYQGHQTAQSLLLLIKLNSQINP